MGKRILQLYVDDEMIQIAKSRQINMSALFRAMLNTEFKLTKSNEVEELKAMNAKLTTSLESANAKIAKLEKQTNGRDPDKRRIIHI